MPSADDLRDQLRQHGDARRQALETAAAELRAIENLVPAARDAGLTKVEIAELGGVSRPTLDALLRR
jgi:hypothetical protein